MKVANTPAEKAVADPSPEAAQVMVIVTPAALQKMVADTAKELLAEVQRTTSLFDGRVIVSEPELAKGFGWQTHVLRDLRRRGEIAYCQLAGRRIGYEMSSVLEYIAKHREEARI